jgi:hypothetical protein
MHAVLKEPAGRSLRVGGPVSSGPLTIYPIHGLGAPIEVPELLMLPEAIDARKLVVRETGRVERLDLEVTGPCAVYGIAGSVVLGARQDRVMRHGFVAIPGASRISAQAFCVEEHRWSRRRGESVRCFTSADKLAPASVRTLMVTGQGQQELWTHIRDVQRDLGTSVTGRTLKSRRSSTSLPLSLQNEVLDRRLNEIVDPLMAKLAELQDVVGHVATFGPQQQIFGEWFAGSTLYQSLQRRLLVASAVTSLSHPTTSIGPPKPAEIAAQLQEGIDLPAISAARAGEAWSTSRRSGRVSCVETTWAEVPAAPLHVLVAV